MECLLQAKLNLQYDGHGPWMVYHAPYQDVDVVPTVTCRLSKVLYILRQKNMMIIYFKTGHGSVRQTPWCELGQSGRQ